MSLNPLEITFHLDGTGFNFDPAEPMHLDSLLAYLLAPFHKQAPEITRDDKPSFVPLPLDMWYINGVKGWKASALFPKDQEESLMFWRKKFRNNRVDLTQGSPSLTNGIYREYNVPMPLSVCTEVSAWCVGDRQRVKQLMKRLRYLGKKSSIGRGQIVDVDVEICGEDFSMVRECRAMRWLPKQGSPRLVRTMPPYWNNTNRVECCEVGDTYFKF